MATTYQRAANQRTDAGALSPLAEGLTTFVESRIKIDVNGREALVTDKDSGISEALMHWSVTQARVFVVRVTLSFLYATGVLAFLGFLSTLGADSAAGDHESDRKKRYLCALSVVVNLVAVAHYKLITKIRSYDFGYTTRPKSLPTSSGRPLPSTTTRLRLVSRWQSTAFATRTG